MTIFELVRQEISAKQAAEMYGLKFDRNGRGFCPWHDDGKHAALQFFPNGLCYCHSCHAHGDATDITAQMLGKSLKDAAWQLYKDFHLNQPVDKRPDPKTQMRAKQERSVRQIMNDRYNYLCDVVRAAEKKLEEYSPETADAEFDLILAAKCKAESELNLLWEELARERS